MPSTDRRQQLRGTLPALQVRGLNLYYGRSHALQGVDLTLQEGVLSLVGRNGMGKTSLCKAIMGLVPVSSGSITAFGEELVGRSTTDIARLGIGYVPQGRRLWRSLSVDEHLRLAQRGPRGSWTPERIYDTFPRLAERKNNAGSQLSGGEQQMLAISRALLLNPRLLIMDEPTEGLAPVIVAQVEDMLVRLSEEGEVAILVIEQNIGVATEISETVAIMVNGRVNRVIEAARLAADRDLQQRLLGVGRHGHEEIEPPPASVSDPGGRRTAAVPTRNDAPIRVYLSNPVLPTRWSADVAAARIEAAARTLTRMPVAAAIAASDRKVGRSIGGLNEPFVAVAGTLDTKGEELRFIADIIKAAGLPVKLVDLSTSGRISGADVPPLEIALHHPRGSAGIFNADRGAAVAAMAEAFETWVKGKSGSDGVRLLGLISAGGSGATALATPAMRALPVGVPKLMISTVASGNTRAYVGPSDITMMYSVTDVQGLNAISRQVLANGAQAMAGMARARLEASKAPPPRRRAGEDRPLVGLTMFGVTTPCVQQVTKLIGDDYECLVFHATGIGGQSMEKLVDGGLVPAVIDVSTTEIADLLFGGVFPATEDRFGAIIRTRIPYVGSVGALDMVNFGAPDTVPERYRGRLLHQHNPQVTLMRTLPDGECRDGPLDRRTAQSDGRPGALPAAGGRGLGTRRGGQAVLRHRGARGAVRRAGGERAADGVAPARPRSASYQQSGVCGRAGAAFSRAARRTAARARGGPVGDHSMAAIDRQTLLARFHAMIARGEPIVGGGAGTGLSAKCEEAGGIDLIVIYNSGRFRMAGRGSLSGLMPYGDANAIVMEMAAEVLPVVKQTPVLAGVCATDPFRSMERFLDEVKAAGFSGVQNFPTVGLIDGSFRTGLEETGMSYALEVEMIALAGAKGLLTTPYVFSADDAAAMAGAGADIIVCHFGLTAGGAIGARTALKLDDVPATAGRLGGGGARGETRCDHPRAWRPGGRTCGRRIRHQELAALPRLLRRLLDGAAAGRSRDPRADPEIQGHQPRLNGPCDSTFVEGEQTCQAS